MVQNMHCYKQRKSTALQDINLCAVHTGIIQASSDDEDDEYDSGSFPDRDAQNLRRIKQRKGHCFIQASSDDEDDKDDDFIPPYTLQDFRTQV